MFAWNFVVVGLFVTLMFLSVLVRTYALELTFGEGMTPPSLTGGQAQPAYTREALEAKVEGKVIARCTITVTGTLTDCRIIKSLAFLDQAVLSTLAGQR